MTQGAEKLDGFGGGQGERPQGSRGPKPRRITVPCSACDQPATITFDPKPGEPVYCNECFQPQPKNIRLDARTPLYPMRGNGQQRSSRGGWGGGSRHSEGGNGYRQQRGRR
jgi:CxxC-x17-CxxC domain-containing protein